MANLQGMTRASTDGGHSVGVVTVVLVWARGIRRCRGGDADLASWRSAVCGRHNQRQGDERRRRRLGSRCGGGQADGQRSASSQAGGQRSVGRRGVFIQTAFTVGSTRDSAIFTVSRGLSPSPILSYTYLL